MKGMEELDNYLKDSETTETKEKPTLESVLASVSEAVASLVEASKRLEELASNNGDGEDGIEDNNNDEGEE